MATAVELAMIIEPERIVEIRQVPPEAYPDKQFLVEVIFDADGERHAILLPEYLFVRMGAR